MSVRNRLECWYLRAWALLALGRVDRRLHALAVAALAEAEPVFPLPALSDHQLQQIHRRSAALAWAARYHPAQARCLHRSIALYGWLRAQGIAARLQIGWAGALGHAWVCYGECVLNDAADVASRTPPLLKLPRQI
ncbi:lasso peptide biosynthesis B2 protein [Gloeobacter kilaueensis]|uniref:Microcin J25-processing protein McjB C-terminal domain-containing protein n=1 Tax=Gloeobacter kilaueensis (strain ATCC BAA-2537 / CCAP 1431/1 / ULC 316 / JS1) TaxID=1183438 RepID=U5QNN1_GLOK1|nr:lasso peptide biosynthesis B2 protein [Gloeobacter kilaueensis]AGY59280.1 hypothetical protein GKIL_3034 [Gloeobacter kilaueensis JS1]